MNITERAAYLKGLLEGMKLDDAKPESKLITEIISLIGDMANDVDNLGEECSRLNDYIEEIDEDLGELEAEWYDDDDCDCDCDDDDFYETECPNCGETVCFDEDCDPTAVTCPACGAEFDCTCDEDCCDCNDPACNGHKE